MQARMNEMCTKWKIDEYGMEEIVETNKTNKTNKSRTQSHLYWEILVKYLMKQNNC